MNSDQSRFPDHFTFAQRYGYEDLPEAMKLEFLSNDLRREFCNAVAYLARRFAIRRNSAYFSSDGSLLFRSIFGEFEGIPDRAVKGGDIADFMNKSDHVLMYGPCHDVLKFLEIAMRKTWEVVHRGSDFRIAYEQLAVAIQKLLEKHGAAYRLDVEEGHRWWFYPCECDEHASATAEALETLRTGGFESAKRHLRNAADHINSGRHGNAVAESIHAVESVARKINPEAKTLTPALKSLQDRGLLRHSALRQAFEKLYGYTSDEQGIRHAQIDEGEANVGLDESLFMFGACAAFAGYLARKDRAD